MKARTGVFILALDRTTLSNNTAFCWSLITCTHAWVGAEEESSTHLLGKTLNQELRCMIKIEQKNIGKSHSGALRVSPDTAGM